MANEHVDFMRMASHTVRECLDALGMPKRAQNILCTYCPTWEPRRTSWTCSITP